MKRKMKSRFLEILRSLNGDSYPQVPPPTPAGASDEAEKPSTLAHNALPWETGDSESAGTI